MRNSVCSCACISGARSTFSAFSYVLFVLLLCCSPSAHDRTHFMHAFKKCDSVFVRLFSFFLSLPFAFSSLIFVVVAFGSISISEYQVLAPAASFFVCSVASFLHANHAVCAITQFDDRNVVRNRKFKCRLFVVDSRAESRLHSFYAFDNYFACRLCRFRSILSFSSDFDYLFSTRWTSLLSFQFFIPFRCRHIVLLVPSVLFSCS